MIKKQSHPKGMVVAHYPIAFTGRNCFVSDFSLPRSSDTGIKKEFKTSDGSSAILN